MKNLSKRYDNIVPSPTLQLDALAKSMMRDGLDVINLSVGEPDIDTPQAAGAAAVAAIRDGFTKYTEVAGIEPLRRAVAERARHFLGLDYQSEQVVVANGGKHALYNIFLALLDAGDEVIIPAPYWVSYPEQVKLAGGVPVICATDEASDFRLSARQLEALVTDRTKAIVLNSPSNPSGAIYGRDDLAEIARFAQRHDLYIVSDEIYDGLVFADTGHVSIAQLGDDALARTIIVNGWSKTYGMTGWRLGYSLSSKPVAKALREIQGHTTSNVCSIAQQAALGALASGPGALADRFRSRRDFMLETMRAVPGVTCRTPGGAFYVFPNLRGLVGASHGGQVLDSVEAVCDVLLRQYHVSIVPGRGFGAPDHARVSYALAQPRLAEAAHRIRQFSQALRRQD